MGRDNSIRQGVSGRRIQWVSSTIRRTERTNYVEPITGDLTERWFQLSHAVGDVAPIEHVPRDRQQARVPLLLERIERDLREYRSLDVETTPLRTLFEGYFD